MIDISGKFADATIYTDLVEDEAISQITSLCNNECASNSKIRIMSDVHAGNGCVIGTTMTIHDRIVPNLVGVDISCGVICCKLQESSIDFCKFDNQVKRSIPSGFNSRHAVHPFASDLNLSDLKCASDIKKLDSALYQVGTLGGGNHMIEVDSDFSGNYYLVIHSGSRGLGKRVAEYYQDIAIAERRASKTLQRQHIIQECNSNGTEKDIGNELSKILPLVEDLAYLEGSSFDNYIHDMEILEEYARLNRAAMVDELVNHAGISVVESFETVHNYVDTKGMILRKGAISARTGEKVIIPMNMRDGSIIAVGKGNPDWNYSAPHGAGRVMGRREAKKTFKLEDFQREMEGIYTTSVTMNTIDESPFVYKPLQEIVKYIGDTVEILEIVKPVYNFKNDGR